MIRHCRTTAIAMVVAGFAVFGFAASAHAQPNDQQFIDQVEAMGIPVGPNDDVPLIGQRVCEMLTGGLTGNPNPVPVVRGVVQRLESSGMSRHQAVGLMRASFTSTARSTEVHGPLTPPARTVHRTPAGQQAVRRYAQNMFAFLSGIPGADEVRTLVRRVDTARHHGVPGGCVLELDLQAVPHGGRRLRSVRDDRQRR